MITGEKNYIILRRKQVEAMTGLSRSSLYLQMSKGLFPQAVRLTERSVGWTLESIENWIHSRIAASRASVSHVQ